MDDHPDDAARKTGRAMVAGAGEAAGQPPERTDSKLLELLVCPVSKGPLAYDAERQELVSKKARLAYPIRRGVPHMLAAEARHLDDLNS